MPSHGHIAVELLAGAIVRDAVLDIRRFATPGHQPEYQHTWFGFGPTKTVREPLPEWAPAWAIADLIHNSVGNPREEYNGVPGWAQALVDLAYGVPSEDRPDDDARRLRAWFIRTLRRNGWTYQDFWTVTDQWRDRLHGSAA